MPSKWNLAFRNYMEAHIFLCILVKISTLQVMSEIVSDLQNFYRFFSNDAEQNCLRCICIQLKQFCSAPLEKKSIKSFS